MEAITLPKTSVVFIEDEHKYYIGESRLSGITSLIHDCLQLGVYPDANDYTRSFLIPRAAEYGKSIHKSIELYDTMGVKVPLHPKSDRFQDSEDDAYWDVAHELESYIANKQGYQSVDNEYTVTDGTRYASQIDNVWLKEETGGIWLADTKSNNIELYPGGETALKEYLSWQLSCYAYLFERQTGLKVEGLACNWLRKGDKRFWVIDRQPDEDVALLLSTPWELVGDSIVYDASHTQSLRDKRGAALAKAIKQEILPRDVIDAIYDLLKAKEEAERRATELKDRLRAAMEEAGVKSWTCDRFRATIAADSETTTLDSKKLKAEYPDVYAACSKKTAKKGGFTIKLTQ